MALAHEHPTPSATHGATDERSGVDDVEAALGTKALRYGRDDHYDVISRVHQEHPGLRPRRRPLLAGPHARGRRGRPLHRPAARDPGLRGRRHGRPDVAAGGRRRRPRRRVRRAARGPAQPGPGRGPPGHGAQVEPGDDLALGPGPRRRARAGRRRGAGHLRDAHYKGAKSLGHGKGYDYPHDDPAGWVDQQYRPAELEGRVYYEPSSHGAEDRVRQRMEQRRQRPTARRRRCRRHDDAERRGDQQ